MSTTPAVGQFFVTRTTGFVAGTIRLLTRSQVNHAGIVIGPNGTTVEAQPGGAVFGNVSNYDAAGTIYSNFVLMGVEALDVANAARALIGTPYNFLDILYLALVSFGFKPRWLLDRVSMARRGDVCSALADKAFHNAGFKLYNDGRVEGSVTPGDLLILVAQGATRPAGTV